MVRLGSPVGGSRRHALLFAGAPLRLRRESVRRRNRLRRNGPLVAGVPVASAAGITFAPAMRGTVVRPGAHGFGQGGQVGVGREFTRRGHQEARARHPRVRSEDLCDVTGESRRTTGAVLLRLVAWHRGSASGLVRGRGMLEGLPLPGHRRFQMAFGPALRDHRPGLERQVDPELDRDDVRPCLAQLLVSGTGHLRDGFQGRLQRARQLAHGLAHVPGPSPVRPSGTGLRQGRSLRLPGNAGRRCHDASSVRRAAACDRLRSTEVGGISPGLTARIVDFGGLGIPTRLRETPGRRSATAV